MPVVIKIENVSKRYRLGLIGTNTLKGDLQSWWYRVRGLPDPTLMIGQENKLSTPNSAPCALRLASCVLFLILLSFILKT
jgi:hypothetical protein